MGCFLGLENLLADWWGTDTQCFGWAASFQGGNNLVPAGGNPSYLLQDFLLTYAKFGTDTDTNAILTATVNVGGVGYSVNDVLTLAAPSINGLPAYLLVTAVNAGVITAFTITSGGKLFSLSGASPLAVTGGTGTGALINITAVSMAAVATLTQGAAGAGYSVNNVLTLVQPGGSLATINVDSIGGGGSIATFHVVNSGTGYSIANGLAVTGGGGAGATFNVTAITGYTGIIPQAVVLTFIMLASQCLQFNRWFSYWFPAMGWFVAHYLTLFLRSEGQGGTTAQQIAVSGLERGLTTAKAAGDVSMSMMILDDLEGWAGWRETTYGTQLATIGKIIGMGPMYVFG